MSNKIEALEDFKKLQANRGYPVPKGYIMGDEDFRIVREIHFIDEQMKLKEERDKKWNALSKEEQEKITKKRIKKENEMYDYLHKNYAKFYKKFIKKFGKDKQLIFDDFFRDM